MEASVGKITWGYIWRLIVWALLTGFVFTFLIGIFIAARPTINGFDSLESEFSASKKNLIATLIVSLIVTVIACKFATSGIQKKFTIDSRNVKQVFRNIVIILIIFTVIYMIYSLNNISGVKETAEQLKSYNSKTVNMKSVDDFSNFAKTFSVISVVLNSLVMILMIPFEKKLLKA